MLATSMDNPPEIRDTHAHTCIHVCVIFLLVISEPFVGCHNMYFELNFKEIKQELREIRKMSEGILESFDYPNSHDEVVDGEYFINDVGAILQDEDNGIDFVMDFILSVMDDPLSPTSSHNEDTKLRIKCSSSFNMKNIPS
jgi:hypothetical protein